MRVIVVGAGVIGLTSALRLAEAGHEVHVMARDLPLETTSAVAAVLWYPYRALPVDRVTGWSATTYRRLVELAAADPDAGVDVRWGTEVLRERAADPWWRDAVPTFQRLSAPPAGYADGWRLPVPVVDMSLYLPWLQAAAEAAGVVVTRACLTALPDAPVVVDATGLAARALAADPDVVPVRGQVVLLGGQLDEWWLDPAGLTYVVPRRGVVVVGGTDDEGCYDRAPSAAAAAAVLDRACALVPGLRRLPVLGHRVGLRPARPTVRLENAPGRSGGAVVHCYGHGGAGVTLSWGCADEVAAEVGALVD